MHTIKQTRQNSSKDRQPVQVSYDSEEEEGQGGSKYQPTTRRTKRDSDQTIRNIPSNSSNSGGGGNGFTVVRNLPPSMQFSSAAPSSMSPYNQSQIQGGGVLLQSNIEELFLKKKKKSQQDERYIKGYSQQQEAEEDEIDIFEEQIQEGEEVYKQNYDYKKYLNQIKNDPDIKKTIRVKHFNDEVVEGKQYKRLPLPEELRRTSVGYLNQPQDERKYIHFSKDQEPRDQIEQVQVVQDIQSYFSMAMRDSTVREIDFSCPVNKLVVSKEITYHRRIRQTRQLFQHILFLSIVEHNIFYSQNFEKIQEFLNELQSVEQTISTKKLQKNQYDSPYNYFFKLVKEMVDEIKNVQKRLKESEQNKKDPNYNPQIVQEKEEDKTMNKSNRKVKEIRQRYKQMNNEISTKKIFTPEQAFKKGALLLTVLQNSIINKEELLMVFENYYLKRDDEQNNLERILKRLFTIESLIYDAKQLKTNMRDINTALKCLNIKLSITHNTQNWHFDFNNRGEIHTRILIDVNENNSEQEFYIMYDERLYKKLTTEFKVDDKTLSTLQQNVLTQPRFTLQISQQTTNNAQPGRDQQGQPINEQLSSQQRTQQDMLNVNCVSGEVAEYNRSLQANEASSQNLPQNLRSNSQQQSQQSSQQQQQQQQEPQLININQRIKSRADCCQREFEDSQLFKVNACRHKMCKECIISPFKHSVNKCLQESCHELVPERELNAFLGQINFEYEPKCEKCKSHEPILKIQYQVTLKPPQSDLMRRKICSKCEEEENKELNKNLCPNCQKQDLNEVKRAKYQQCINCKYLQCTHCKKIIDRYGKERDPCKCRCNLCLELNKNESQDQNLNQTSICSGCDKTCMICRVQRRDDNLFRCKDCSFYACYPCIFKVSAIKSLNTNCFGKCTHLKAHLNYMEETILPKIDPFKNNK